MQARTSLLSQEEVGAAGGKGSFPWLSGVWLWLCISCQKRKNYFLKRTSPRALWSPCLVSIALLQKPLFRPRSFASHLPCSGEKHGPLQGPVSSSVLLGKVDPAVALIQVYPQTWEAAQCSTEVPNKFSSVGPQSPHLQNGNKARAQVQIMWHGEFFPDPS